MRLQRKMLKRKNLVFKEKSGTTTKLKLVAKFKKHYWLNFEALVLALYCFCGDNTKYRFLSKHWVQRKQQHGS